jgi:hypothetical protein
VKNRRAGPKAFVYTGVANLGDFPPKKANFGIPLKNVLCIFIWTFEVLKRFFCNLGWQPCFHRTGTFQ